MDIEQIQALANQHRASATRAANELFKIPEGFSSGLVDQMISDIVGCAIMEVAVLQAKAVANLGK